MPSVKSVTDTHCTEQVASQIVVRALGGPPTGIRPYGIDYGTSFRPPYGPPGLRPTTPPYQGGAKGNPTTTVASPLTTIQTLTTSITIQTLVEHGDPQDIQTPPGTTLSNAGLSSNLNIAQNTGSILGVPPPSTPSSTSGFPMDDGANQAIPIQSNGSQNPANEILYKPSQSAVGPTDGALQAPGASPIPSGVIAGALVGGLLLVAMVIAAACYVHKQRRRARGNSLLTVVPNTALINYGKPWSPYSSPTDYGSSAPSKASSVILIQTGYTTSLDARRNSLEIPKTLPPYEGADIGSSFNSSTTYLADSPPPAYRLRVSTAVGEGSRPQLPEQGLDSSRSRDIPEKPIRSVS